MITNSSTLGVWKHPSSYLGFSPEGDYLILNQHSQSDPQDASNYRVAFQRLKEVVKDLASPPKEFYREELSPRSEGWVYDFRASHCLVGWVEYLLIRSDAPEELINEAEDLVYTLKNEYYILDESDCEALKAEWGWKDEEEDEED
jgi:hypothetical protein